MLIRLEHRQTRLFEVDAAAIEREIDIGRSRQCAWVVPQDEKSVSGRHVAISREGSTVWLKDLDSANGTFCRGKRVTRMKLRPGDRVTIGGCELIVEAGDKAKAGPPVPELVVLTGQERNRRLEIKPPKFTIGSDPQSSLVFLDPLISRAHAEILVKDDGGCWLRDLGSRNGSAVNGAPLRSGQERLLKEGDKVSFAHLEVVFHDGTIRTSGKKLWLRVGIMAATGVVVLGAYWGCQAIRPSATGFLAAARRAAAGQDFPRMRTLLDRAASARGADRSRLELEDLSREAALWERTLRDWTQAQADLGASDWVGAARGLGELAALKKDAWTWSPAAVDARDAALRAKNHLDALLHANALLKRDDAPFASVVAEQEKIRSLLAAPSGALPPYLQALRSELQACQIRLGAFLAESTELEKALEGLAAWPPAVPRAEEALERTLRASKGALRRRCELLSEPVKALGVCLRQYNEAVELVRQMKFEAAGQVDAQLPEASVCALDSRVSAARGNLDAGFEKLRAQANQLLYLFREVNKSTTGPQALPAPIAAWQDAAAVEKAFSCDSLNQPMPRRSRAEPSGEYDRYFGVEEFHEYLMALVLRQQWSGKPLTPFTTVLTQSEGIVGAIEAILSFFGRQNWAVQLTAVNEAYSPRRLDGTWADATNAPAAATNAPAAGGAGPAVGSSFLGGPLAVRVAELRQVLAARDAIAGRMLEIARTDPGRRGILAAGVAFRLSSDPKKAVLDSAGLEPWIVQRMEANRAKVRELGREYDLGSPERQVALRDQILQEGIPGDPIVRRMWASRAAAR